MFKSSSGGNPSRAETREQCKPLSGLNSWRTLPQGMGSFCALSYHFMCSSFLVFPPASSASSLLLSRRVFGQGPCDSYVSVFVISVVLPFPTCLLFILLASAFMGTRSLQVHGQVRLKTVQRPLAPIEERRGVGDVCASSLPLLAACIRHFPLVPV